MLRIRFDFKGCISVYLLGKTALKRIAIDSLILKCKNQRINGYKLLLFFVRIEIKSTNCHFHLEK